MSGQVTSMCGLASGGWGCGNCVESCCWGTGGSAVAFRDHLWDCDHCCVPADAHRPPHSPFYQLPPSVQRPTPEQLLLAPTPPALHRLLGEHQPGPRVREGEQQLVCTPAGTPCHAAEHTTSTARAYPARGLPGSGITRARVAV